MASHFGVISPRSSKGKQRGDLSSYPVHKAGPSTALIPSSKGLPEPGIFQTRPSQPLHTSPSFERGRQSTVYGDMASETTSAYVTGADGQGEASYSRAGSHNTAQWDSSSSSGPGPSSKPRPRPRAHPADTTFSEAYKAVGDDYVHARDPEFWEERRLSREAAIRRAEQGEPRRRRQLEPISRESSEGCCTLF